ncbi:hypothetical protein [Paenibacillus larvae]|uniref:hypothetical protein n=1 Tax=Paenibacillus larvae TaxID=1464 RepID=UPI00288E9FE8|nr:hypothetical protein [Paenibacillus larvae]MDT2278139.1 hypothetical protein [Paenibacillus larvae]
MTREDYARYVRNLQSIIDAFEYGASKQEIKNLIEHQEQLRKHKEELEEIKNKYRQYEEQRK